MSSQNNLYQAILARSSVRRYEREALDATTLAQVQVIVHQAKPLVPGNRFSVLLRDVARGENLVRILGGYGQIVTPPHYLVPYMAGEGHLLADLGYRVEQIAVRLTMLGLGSCYIGSLGREDRVRKLFALPANVRSAAFLVFGRPSRALTGRVVNTAMRTLVGATNKMPVERIFFQDSFAHPSVPPVELAALLEAARHAPSAANAQPWRFLWHRGRLHLFVTRHNLRYGGGTREDYRLYDGGICMANVVLAMEALGMDGRWVLYEGTEANIPSHPEELQPLAVLVMKKQG